MKAEPERDTDPEMTEMKEQAARPKKVDPDDAYDRMREIEEYEIRRDKADWDSMDKRYRGA